MIEITFKELRKVQLNMLENFISFCDMNKITYFLSGGTLLGAVRHQGFIPWDDDIDIMMPRPEYERLNEIFKHEYLEIVSITKGTSKSICSQLVDRRTVVCGLDNVQMVFLDIFIIDAWPDNKVKQKMFCYTKELLMYICEGSMMEYKPTLRYNDTHAGFCNWKKHIRTAVKYLMITLFSCFSTKVIYKILDNYCKLYKYGETKHAGVLLTSAHHHFGMGEVMPIDNWFGKEYLQFEHLKCSVPIGYKEYLLNLYGDYMKLPPEDKRKTRHEFKAYWRE